MKWLQVVGKDLLMVAIVMATISCHKSPPYMSTAEITGWDPKMCPCCGGLEITIDNVQNPVGNSYYLINKMPSYFLVDDHTKFPIPVRIDWVVDTFHCGSTRIDITRIEKR